MAHKKGVGSTDNGRDSISKRLGVKLYGGQHAKAGNIIIRQRGTKFHPGLNVNMGKDHTIHALVEGTVSFTKGRKNRRYVNIVPVGGMAVATPPAKKAKKKVTKPVETAPVVEAAPAVEEAAPVMAAANDSAPAAKDKLTKIEGIGPKIQEKLNEGGIMTFAQLAATSLERLQEIMEAAGSRYRMHDPGTWAEQAALAAAGKWDELEKLQDELDGGKRV